MEQVHKAVDFINATGAVALGGLFPWGLWRIRHYIQPEAHRLLILFSTMFFVGGSQRYARLFGASNTVLFGSSMVLCFLLLASVYFVYQFMAQIRGRDE